MAVAYGARTAPSRLGAAATTESAAAQTAAPLPRGATAPAEAPPSAHLVDDACSFDEPQDIDAEKRSAKPFVVWTRKAAVRPDDRYDLVIHIHGGEAARRVVLPRALPVVLATLDRGSLSGDYKGTFPDRRAFDAAVAAIDGAASDVVGRPVRADRVVISSFSAGYGALGELLASLGEDAAPSGVILLDSLHAGYKVEKTKEIDAVTLEPVLTYGRRALEGRGYLALTHSAIVPPGYASTSEVATYLLTTLAVESTPIEAGSTGLALRRVAKEKGLVVRGYAGDDKGAHCAHLTLLPELIEGWMAAR
ncbi:MAG: hypothetical protein JNL21_06710 [Myxococcales bacterium]|nr:hypothetical protein [Myxococcales bacterium]